MAGIVAAIVILRLPPLASAWQQNYDPLGHWFLSALVAAIPIAVLLGSLALGHIKAHYAALAGLLAALATSIIGFHMPARLAAATAVYGAGYGLFPIGWIVLNVIFIDVYKRQPSHPGERPPHRLAAEYERARCR